MEILDSYITSAPSIQNAVDIFKGEWASSFPGYLNVIEAGKSPLFDEDPRVSWSAEKIGGIQGKTILELGPLEAGHTYKMERLGAASIIAVEANRRAYLKCLIVKEILNLNRAHFLCGDCVEYLRKCPDRFDLCFASGILYHMINPVELLALISKVSDRIFIWTHYYDAEVINSNPQIAHKFPESKTAEWDGFQHTLYRYEYKNALDSAGFCGGSNPFSNWMSREEILSCLKYFGFTDIEIAFENREHQNGPCFGLMAIRGSQSPQMEERSQSDFDAEALEKLRWEFQQAKLEVQRCSTQFNETKAELEQSQVNLHATRSELEQTQANLHANRSELEQTQAILHANRSELEQTQAILHANRSELEQTQAQLHANRSELEQTQAQLHATQIELGTTQQELLISKQTIAAMQSSKFWKLRQQWFKMKKIVGLGENE